MRFLDEIHAWMQQTEGWDRQSLLKWMDFCDRMATVRGPDGITLEGINPSIMENAPLREQYREVKQRYDAVLGRRKVLNTHIDDLAVQVLDADELQKVVGYSFFIESADWTPEMREEYTRRKMEQARFQSMFSGEPVPSKPVDDDTTKMDRVRQFFQEADPNKAKKLLELLEANRLKRKQMESPAASVGPPAQRLAPEPKVVAPIISAAGGFFKVYSDCIPALIINNLIPQVKSDYIDLHVIHRGFKHVSDCDIPMEKLIHSAPFRVAANKPVRPRTVRRICVWYGLPDHVMMLVWDTICVASDSVRHVCYSVDCQPDLNTRALLCHFCLCVEQLCCVPGTVQKMNNLITPDEIRVEHGGLMCVSFVARATIYLSMLIDPCARKDYIQKMSHFDEGNRLEAFLYKCFEMQLFRFVRDRTLADSLLMFAPDNMYEYYVNCKDVKLILETPGQRVIQTVNYNGVQNGFTVEPTGSVCYLQSRFHSPLFNFGYC